MVETIEFIGILLLCLLAGDLSAPLLVWLFYRFINASYIFLRRIPFTISLAERINKKTPEDIRSIKPPKTIKYLRYCWEKTECIHKFVGRMVNKFQQRITNVLNKDFGYLTKSPFSEFANNSFSKPLHLTRIIKAIATKCKRYH